MILKKKTYLCFWKHFYFFKWYWNWNWV